MAKLLICSEPDIPSVNMRKSLLKMAKWDMLGEDKFGTFESMNDMVIMTTPQLHIYDDTLVSRAEEFGIKVDSVIVLSKHSAASGKPTLTVHPIGNYGENKYGGKAGELVPSDAHMMTETLRKIVEVNDTDIYSESFEVTHHGPWMETPTYFIEIGSDENHWGDEHAADLLAKALLETEPKEDYPILIGFGGGHYAPRYTEIATKFKADFGHMLPSYQMLEKTDEEVLAMAEKTAEASGTKMVYMHKKAFKKSEEHSYSEMLESAGFELLSSKDLEPLN